MQPHLQAGNYNTEWRYISLCLLRTNKRAMDNTEWRYISPCLLRSNRWIFNPLKKLDFSSAPLHIFSFTAFFFSTIKGKSYRLRQEEISGEKICDGCDGVTVDYALPPNITNCHKGVHYNEPSHRHNCHANCFYIKCFSPK